jgi:ribosome maturation factor RimP
MQLQQTIADIVKPIVDSASYNFAGLEIIESEDGTIIRIYIDKDVGVSVGDCAKVSRKIEQALDLGLEAMKDYILEVSSPGIDRKFSPQDVPNTQNIPKT